MAQAREREKKKEKTKDKGVKRSIHIDEQVFEDRVDNLCNLLSTRSYSRIIIGDKIYTPSKLLEGDEWKRLGEAICSNSKNLRKHSLSITLYPLFN